MAQHSKFERLIWQLEIEYEAWTQATTSEVHANHVARSLFQFLGNFPEARVPEDIQSTDVADWIESLRAKGLGEGTLHHKLDAVRGWYKWMREEKGLDVQQPVVVRLAYEERTPIARLDLKSLARLAQALESRPIEAALIRNLLAGASYPQSVVESNLSASTLQQRWRRLRRQIDFPEIPLKHLHKAYQSMCLRLGALAVARYLPNLQPGQPALLEPKPPSDSLRNVQVPPANIGTPIGYLH